MQNDEDIKDAEYFQNKFDNIIYILREGAIKLGYGDLILTEYHSTKNNILVNLMYKKD